MGGLLFQGKLSPKNISFNFPQTLPNTHSPPTSAYTHTPYHCGSAVLCCWEAEVAFVGCVHSGRASECLLPPAASAPGSGCQPARRPTSLNPCQAPDANLGGPASRGSGRALLKSPPPPLLSGSPSSRKQTRCVPDEELHRESVNVASDIFVRREDVDVLYFWGFWKNEKWEKNVCRQGHLYLVRLWVCVYLFAWHFLGKRCYWWFTQTKEKFCFIQIYRVSVSSPPPVSFCAAVSIPPSLSQSMNRGSKLKSPGQSSEIICDGRWKPTVKLHDEDLRFSRYRYHNTRSQEIKPAWAGIALPFFVSCRSRESCSRRALEVIVPGSFAPHDHPSAPPK